MISPRLVLLLALALFSASTSWYFTRLYYLNDALATQQREQEIQYNIVVAYAERIRQGDDEHATNQVIINNLRNDLNKRVRIKLPTCNNPTTSNKDTDGGDRLFSERTDESFARFEQRLTELAARCDQLNIDAIRNNTTSK